MGVAKFFQHIDLAKNELRNVLLHILGSDPGSPTEGQTYYNSTDKVAKFYNGTAWVDMQSGTPSDNSVTSAKIANGAILNEDVNASAAIAYSKLNLVTSIVNNDVATGAAITHAKMESDARARANHTGTQLAATVSDFDTQVRTSTLNQMTAPTADLSINTHKLTGVSAGTADTDAVNFGQLSSVSAGIDWKGSVRVATAAAGTLASDFENGDTVDGVVLATGDRILLKDQAAGAENGLYVVAASGAPARASDANVSAEVTGGLAVWVNEGSANADSGWVLTTNDAITLDTTALVFTQFSGLGQVTAGGGIGKTGNTLSVAAGTGITQETDGVAIDTAVVARKFSVAIGDGAATSFVVTHSLGTRNVLVSVVQAATPWDHVFPTISSTSTTTVTVDFSATVPTSGQYVCNVIG